MKQIVDLCVVINNADKTTGFLGVNEYLGVSYIKSFLEQEKNVQVNIRIIYPQQEIHTIFSYNPDIIGFSVFSDNIRISLDIAEKVKKYLPETPILFGGPQVNNYEKEILKENSFIDYVVSYEGEETIAELTDCISKSKTVEDIKGLTYRNKSGDIIKNAIRQPRTNLDSLPYPSRAIHEKVRQKFFYIAGSRGCLGGCSFCGETSIKKEISPPYVRLRSAESVVDEMQFLINKYKINSFRLTDATFEDPGSDGFRRANDIFNMIIARDIKVSLHIFTRAELVVKEPDSYFEKAKKAGVECFYIGIEAGNDNDLKLYNKKASVVINLEAINKVRKAGIHVCIGFICFNPYSTHESLLANAKFLKDVNFSHVFYLYQTRLEILPQSLMIKKLKDDGLIHSFDYKSYFYDYDFMDKRIEKLYIVCKNAYTQAPIYYMDTLLGMDRVYVNRLVENDRVVQIKERFHELDRLCNSYSEINNELFEKLTIMSANGASVEQMQSLADKYRINDIYKEFEIIYNKINHKVIRERYKEIL